ncbi:MAG: hypothetical protein ORN98_07455 [Alphaproteobacteria bacterium]|nr:hypothetical protein [Alphaproteobacteria bacterium]
MGIDIKGDIPRVGQYYYYSQLLENYNLYCEAEDGLRFYVDVDVNDHFAEIYNGMTPTLFNSCEKIGYDGDNFRAIGNYFVWGDHDFVWKHDADAEAKPNPMQYRKE